ncbi:MAG: hypothetical protein K2M53_10255 [Muribaculaceae bacterium]|nr:hypothetical protein [Muribaculaceae bacterium]
MRIINFMLVVAMTATMCAISSCGNSQKSDISDTEETKQTSVSEPEEKSIEEQILDLESQMDVIVNEMEGKADVYSMQHPEITNHDVLSDSLNALCDKEIKMLKELQKEVDQLKSIKAE